MCPFTKILALKNLELYRIIESFRYYECAVVKFSF